MNSEELHRQWHQYQQMMQGEEDEQKRWLDDQKKEYQEMLREDELDGADRWAEGESAEEIDVRVERDFMFSSGRTYSWR